LAFLAVYSSEQPGACPVAPTPSTGGGAQPRARDIGPAVTSQIACVGCRATRDVPLTRLGVARTPARWKLLRGALYCPTCKTQAFALRAVTLPVVGPEGATWAELRATLRAAWADATACANWMTTELYARDVRREPEDTTLRAMPRVYLYPEARALWPALSPQTVASLELQVRRVYRAQRYELLWTRARSLATHRYPVPLPIPAQAWSLHEQDGRYVVSCRLGDRRWRLRLRGGPHMHFHREVLAQIAAGDADVGALALYQTTTHTGDHRSGVTPQRRLMCKLVAWLPRGPQHGRTGTMTVRTDPTRLLVATREGTGRPWVLCADQIRRALLADGHQRERLAVDLKAERRVSRRERQGMVDRLGRMAERQRRQFATWCHEVARQIVGYAARQRVATLVYDDRERSYLPHFPWHQLASRVREKCETAGIAYVAAQGELTPDRTDPFAKEDRRGHPGLPIWATVRPERGTGSARWSSETARGTPGSAGDSAGSPRRPPESLAAHRSPTAGRSSHRRGQTLEQGGRIDAPTSAPSPRKPSTTPEPRELAKCPPAGVMGVKHGRSEGAVQAIEEDSSRKRTNHAP
jgi:hypothetical protein